MAPAYDPRKFRSGSRSPRFIQLQVVGNNLLPQQKSFPCSCVPVTAQGWHEAITGAAALLPSTGTPTGPVVHEGHQNLYFFFVETSTSIHRHHGMAGGRESEAEPGARHSRPPCTATGLSS